MTQIQPSRSFPFQSRRRITAAFAVAALILGGALSVETEPPVAHANGVFGSLPTGDGPSDIVIANGFAYIANVNADTVSIFDTSDWSFVGNIAVGASPDYVSANADGSEVWVSNTGNGIITILDTSTNTVDRLFAPGGTPGRVLFTADGSKAYVLNSALDKIQVIGLPSMSVNELSGALSGPREGVLSADEQSIFFDGTAGSDRILRLDLTDGTIDYDDTVSLPEGGSPDGVTLSPDGTTLWVIGADADSNGRVFVLNALGSASVATIPLASPAGGITFSLAGDRAYVTEYLTDTVAVIDTTTFEVITRITAGNEPFAVTTEQTGKVVVTSYLDDEIVLVGLDTERLAGANRYETAVAVSEFSFPTTSTTVFIANGLNFPDALAAGPAAGALDGSLLLTSPNSLPAVVRDEIIRLQPETIYIVGGTSAVSTAVEAALDAIDTPGPTDPTVVRLSGANRYLTGAAIVEEVWDGVTVPEVFIATGRNYPDALSAGAVAAGEEVPVILVDGNQATVPASTLALITSLGPSQITIAGGPSVVSASIMNQLTVAFGAADVRRLAGADRYGTSAVISADAYPTSESVILATGANFPDALAAATLAARASAPLYLTPTNCASAGALEGIYGGQAPYLFLLGGTSVLSPAVEALTPC